MGVRFACGDRVHVAVTSVYSERHRRPRFSPREESEGRGKGEEKGGRAARSEEEGGDRSPRAVVHRSIGANCRKESCKFAVL